jgi:predicted outer membrane repeat protein
MPNLITVTSVADSGEGSLRAAIAAAQDGDIIQFDGSLANQTIALSGDIAISKNIEVDGSGAANLAISGNRASRIFSAGGGVNFAVKNLAIVDGKTDGKGGGIWLRDSGTAITVVNCRFENNEAGVGGAIQIGYGGRATVLNSQFNGNKGISANNGFSAGAIANDGSGELVIKDSQFTNNQGFNGGAIYSLLSSLTVENCKFLNNEAIGEGGGAIFTDGGNPVGPGGTVAGTIAVRGSWFEGNKAKGEGGALFLYGYQSDKIILEDSTVINNSVSKGTQGFGNGVARGGGLRSNSDLTIRNVTFANNTSAGQGGGIWIDGDSPTNIFNSTFSGNRVTDDVGGAMVFNTGINAPVNIVNTTIVNNWANRANGAIWMNNENQPVTLTNSIVAFNTASGVYYEPRDGGGNVEYPAPTYPGRRVAANSQIVDPQIDTLQNVGGMLVHPLLAGSPAVNAGVVYPKTLGVTNIEPIGGTDNDALVYTQPIGVIDTQTISAKKVEQRNVSQNVPQNVQQDPTPEIGASEVPLNTSDTGKVPSSKYVKVNGSAANDVLVGNAEYNYLAGVAGDDMVVGNSKQDILVGGLGDDTLIGNRGSDRQIGGAGADRFVYSGSSRLSAFRDSTLNRLDQISDFNAAEGDRIKLDFDSKFATTDLPKGLSVTTHISGRSLLDAVNAAYADKNSAAQGAQALSTEESVLLKWNNRTFLVINDKTLGFSRGDDLVVELMGVNLTTLLTNAGTLAVESYFA